MVSTETFVHHCYYFLNTYVVSMLTHPKRIIWGIVLMSALYTSAEFYLTTKLTFSYPIWSFLTSPIGRFDDFYNNLVNDSGIWFPSRAGFVLFPGSVTIYKALSNSFISELQAFILFNLLTYSLVLVSVFRTFRTFEVRVLVLTSYPMFVAFWRANNEPLLFAMFLLAIWHLSKDQPSHNVAAGWFQGLHAILEGNPFLFLALYQQRSTRMRLFLLTSLKTMTICFGFFLVISGVSPLVYGQALLEFIAADGDLNFGLMHNHSLVAGVSSWIRIFIGEYPNLNTPLGTAIFAVLLPIAALALTVYISIVLKYSNFYDKLICTVSLFLLLPTHSYTYRQIWLLAPLGLMLDGANSRRPTTVEWLQIGIISIIILPKTFFRITSPFNSLGHYESTLIDPALCLVLLAVTFKKCLKNRNWSPSSQSHGLIRDSS